MADTLDASQLTGEARLVLDHGAAEAHFGTSVFWLRRLAAWSDEQAAIEFQQIMIATEQELTATLERIRHLQDQLAHLRTVETNPVNYHLSASGLLAEMDRMQLEVREYLSVHPDELKASA